MTTIRNSVLIRRGRAYVFDHLSDPRSELSWNPGVQHMEKIDDGPVGVGSRFAAKWKLSKPLTVTITRYDRPAGWSTTNDGPIIVDLDVSLDEHPDGTVLRSTFDAKPHGRARLIFPIFLLAIRREEKHNMAHLKTWLESELTS